MRAVNNPLSSMSYTNKDFQTIYPELLEAAKNLAKNWDPTISNESDPGVVLLKLSAIIGDKNNYNIDKNVLENYPETYTQEVSARSQYRQLGYKMPWYRAATVPVTFRWVGRELALGQYLTIPKHTLLADNSGEHVFTLLEDVTIRKMDYSASLTSTGKVMQGVINRLSIVGSDVINLSHLDSNNRLYINSSNIAENGIFVRNDGSEELWDQVYNVETQSPLSKCYEFDIDQRKNCPYIQFPADIYSTIGNGLIVEYITTDGYNGNVAANTIDSYVNESSIVVKSMDLSVEDESVQLTTSNVKVFNTYSTSETAESVDDVTSGKDPETIEEARLSYKKIAGTFDTLVTLRDYMNAIYMMSPEVASNVIVTDRTNDIQCSYRIVSKYPSVTNTTTYFTGENKYIFTRSNSGEYIKGADGQFSKGNPVGGALSYSLEETEEKDMTPFDLKLYLLKTSDTLPMIDAGRGILKYNDNTLDAYDSTFEIDNDTTTRRIIDVKLDDKKSIQHDFVDIKHDLPFMLQAVYPIKLKIIPTYKLDETHKKQVEASIKATLIKLLNSRKCEFGVEPDYNVIYDKIASCDERIKTVIMDDFVYTLFAVYLGYKFDENGNETDDEEFKYVPVSDYSACDRAVVISMGEANSTQESAISDELHHRAEAIADDEGKSVIEDYIFIDSYNGIMYRAELDDDENIELKKYSDRLKELRKQIIAKNVLAGVTPLYEVDDDIFTTTIDMQQVGSESVNKITTNLEIHPFGIDSEYSPDKRKATYTLKENESIRCLAPSFIMDKSFSSYTKFEVTLASPITSLNNYIVADPNDEDAIINRYGYSLFHTRTSEGVYTKANSSAYLKLETTPRYKLDSYYRKVNRGQGVEYDIINVNTDNKLNIDEVATAASNTAFEFGFEKNLYYIKENNKYLPISEYPHDGGMGNWGPDYYSNSCYKLRQYMGGEVWMDLRTYLVGASEITANSLSNTLSNKLYYHNEADGEKYKVVAIGGEGLSAPSFYDAAASVTGETQASEIKYFVEVSEELSSTNTDLKFENNCEESYIPLGYYGSNVYKVIRTNDASRTIVGYEMVMLNFDKTLCSAIDGNYDYILVKYPDVWNPDNYAIRYFDNKRDTATIAGGLNFSDIKYIPNKPEVLYELKNDKYVLIEPDMSNWMNTYTDYYVRESFDGVHPSSSEYTQWQANQLNLYVPEVAYKIPANTEYQLREGDSVKFFWRDVDESDAPYNYECYKGTSDEYSNPIIKANFTISGKSPSDERINSNKLDSSGSIAYDMGTDSDYYKIFYDMSGGEDDLGASRSIEVRRINQVRMIIDGDCKNRYYYVITNNTVTEDDKKYYTLKLDQVSGNRYKHILQPDEYFFYVNEDKTLYGVVGEGTLIDFTTDNGEAEELVLKSEVVKSTDISFRGISAFKQQCKEISKNDDIKLIEQQVYSFTEGDTLQFDLKQNYDYSYVKSSEYDATATYCTRIDSYVSVTPISVSSSKKVAPPFIPNYYYKKSGEEYELLTSEPDDWNDSYTDDNLSVTFSCSNYYYLDTNEYEVVDNVTEENYGNYYKKIVPEYPIISTSTPFKLDNIDISYSTEGTNNESSGKAFTQLPQINVKDDEYKWSVTSYLNLNMSSTTSQKIPAKDNQSISSITVGKLEYDGNTRTKDIYFMSDIPVSRTGGSNVDVSWMDLLGKSNDVKIFSYQMNDSVSSDSGFEKLSDSDEIKYEIDKGEEGTILITDIQLDPKRNHLLPIEIVTDELEITKISVATDNDSTIYSDLPCVCCDSVTLEGIGKHFIRVDSGTKKLKIVYKNTSNTEESAIKFHKIFKYGQRELFGGGEKVTQPKYGITTSDIEAEIRALDIPKEFDYCHIPSVSDEIPDPLDPISVFSGNHVFNKFSIPKAEIRTEKPYSAEIDFVNNR